LRVAVVRARKYAMIATEEQERVLLSLASLSRRRPDARAIMLRLPLLPVDFLFQSLKERCPYLTNVLGWIEEHYTVSHDALSTLDALDRVVPPDALQACMQVGFATYTEKMAQSMERGDVDALLTFPLGHSTW